MKLAVQNWKMGDIIVLIFAVFIFIESDSEYLLVRFLCHSYQSADLEKTLQFFLARMVTRRLATAKRSRISIRDNNFWSRPSTWSAL